MRLQFAQNYPFAIGPRAGFAYQIDRKTVVPRRLWRGLRPDQPFSCRGAGHPVYASSAFATSDSTLSNFKKAASLPASNRHGLPFSPMSDKPATVHPRSPRRGGWTEHSGRPPGPNQFSVGIRREISHNLVMEVSYVGNRGCSGWAAASGPGA